MTSQGSSTPHTAALSCLYAAKRRSANPRHPDTQPQLAASLSALGSGWGQCHNRPAVPTPAETDIDLCLAHTSEKLKSFGSGL